MNKKYLQNFYNQYKVFDFLHSIRQCGIISFWIFLSVLFTTSSSLLVQEYPGKVRQYTHTIEFDYVNWTFDAFWQKFLQSSIRLEDYLPEKQPSGIVREYLRSVRQISQLESQINVIYADPKITDKVAAAKSYQLQLDQFNAYKKQLAPYAESTLQSQISTILSENGLTLIGQPIPPVLYHSTPLPMALIVSPRNKIQQDANISLLADMTAGDMAALEDEVMKNLNVSALVVPIGGVGIYPTMVMSTSDLSFLAETVAHEWTHNFLTLRPLGINYETNSDLRTINETTASIVGTEIGKQVLKRYYPDLLPPESEISTQDTTSDTSNPQATEPEPFNFRREMHTTRVQVDKLLAENKIDEAETYMEQRRQFFWDNGYMIRRLNQAYFAFYGAYADTPGGAAGTDPVGPMVRALRKQSSSLAAFLNQISMVTSFDQLTRMVNNPPAG